MKDLSDIMRQAQEMQKKLAETQAKMEDISAEGSAGAGMVTVTLKGKGVMERLSIDPSLLVAGEGEILEDLVKAAHADAKRKLEEQMEKAMQDATGGLGGMLPGFKMPF